MDHDSTVAPAFTDEWIALLEVLGDFTVAKREYRHSLKSMIDTLECMLEAALEEDGDDEEAA